VLITVATKHSIEELLERVPKACAEEKFGVLGVLDLRAKLREKGQPYDRACVIFEVCRPDVARRALESAPEIAAALPCRIAAFERADGTRALATLDPRGLLELVGAPGASELAPEVERALRNILTRSA
jgi:uncharacterized protein (DUF302 family)